MTRLQPAAFLDRDGTLIEERSYPVREEDIVPLPGVGGALRRLQAAGFLTIVLTNQSAVARGMLDEQELGRLHQHLARALAAEGGGLDDIFYCPHHPEGVNLAYAQTCRCRKPGPGLLEQALARHDIDLSASIFVGDARRDLFLDAGPCRARALVQSGHALDDVSCADLVVPTLVEAVERILAER